MLSLSRVPGYKSVFRALEIQNSKAKKVMEIPLADSKKFFCRILAFLLTVEQGGRLNGSWELDLAEFPDKSNWSFQKDQIWALNIGRYGQIKKIESSPARLHVDLLELCSDVNRPISCGLFRASKGARQIFQQDSLFIVEVVKSNEDFISILALSRVPGFKSVFRALEIQNSKAKKIMEIPLADSKRFFCRIPAFLLTVEQDGRLNGSWELDLAEFPGKIDYAY
ncbi:hypothetical protein Tco_1408037 [Tanacetum coccineum]